MGSLEQLRINLTIRVPPQPAQEREPSRRRPWHQGPGDADCRWNLFSMYCRPVGQVIFANWLATTSAMSGKSPIHSSRRLVTGSRIVESDLRTWHRFWVTGIIRKLVRAKSPDVGSDVSMKNGYAHIFDDVFRPLYKERHEASE